MAEPGARFYLLHSERRLLTLLFEHRNHPLGVNREKALRWVQGEGERLARLQEAGILTENAGIFSLSFAVRQFMEAELGLATDYRLGTLVEEYERWVAKIQADGSSAVSQGTLARATVLQQQLERWTEQIPALIDRLQQSEEQNQLNELATYLDQIAIHLRTEAIFRTTASLALENQTRDFQEAIVHWKGVLEQRFTSPLQQHLFQLQRLRWQGLLTTQTNIETVLSEDHALLWQEKPRFQTLLKPEDVAGTRKRKLRKFALPQLPETTEKASDVSFLVAEVSSAIAGVALSSEWAAFLQQKADLLSFLQTRHSDWEPIFFQLVFEYGSQLQESGKPVKIGEQAFARLVPLK